MSRQPRTLATSRTFAMWLADRQRLAKGAATIVTGANTVLFRS